MMALFVRRTSGQKPLVSQIEAILRLTEDCRSATDLLAIRNLISGPITPSATDRLADLNVYIELEGASHQSGRSRMLQRLLQDAGTGRFQRLIVSAIPAFGRTIREVVSIVCELLALGITIIPARSDADCIDPGMVKVLRLVESWHRELDHHKRSAAIKAGQIKVRAKGKRVGRPKRIFDRQEVVRLRDAEGLSWTHIAQALGVGAGTARRAYQQLAASPRPAKTIREVT